MISGKVNELLEAVIPLTVIGREGLRAGIESVIDTGFNGFLTLDTAVIQTLKLFCAGSRRASLADGSVVALDVYLGNVDWQGEIREVLVIEAAGGSLAGMSLLNGSCMVVEVVADGDVTITPSQPGDRHR